ncbi:MAG: RnfABCDGE type electron transport complex subunit D, partial [Oscillospiraceae bacterium]|nr:RnfABCDGE type electron transport complex subunit D [Oscillospiraceae bacterium]
QCVVGAAFAIIVVKCLFGGLGCNFANPAITARVFMLITFSAVAGGSTELYSGATPLELIGVEGAALPGMGAMFLGTYGGAIGETSSIALLIGFAYLLVRKVISWHIPVVFIATVFVLSLVAGGANFALYQILAGGLFIGAIFMATDYVTSPITKKGKIIFAVGCGLITFIVRYFCSYPEGVSFSILIMNLFVPIIERFSRNIPLGGGK